MTRGAAALAARLERHQVAVYLAAMAAGAIAGWTVPAAGPALEHAINPVLGALLYVTFLQVPAADLVRSFREGRFLAATLAVNFAVVPLVVAALFLLLPADRAVRLGVLLVLLTPCVDYVIVFCRLAGGSGRRLLAATPLLLVSQMALLPLFLLLFLGPDLADVVEFGPFVRAFVVLILIPLTAAWLTQAWAARGPAGRAVATGAGTTMVPLMAGTLATVVASQVPALGGDVSAVLVVVPFYLAFLVVMPFAGLGMARLFRLDARAGRAVVFSGATRNSLVVLPLALALPDALAVAALVVVTQTLVEVVGMVLYVRVIPRLLPLAASPRDEQT
ncbi:ACR3 family arsenite efflux pump ArsB [Actinoalloteichus hoggarensis]|uniref:Sodium Bile acid symporter family protein n=1 Tax=Actinoalloteichus hoggarensis TaxID=1470176 RepID=A0A221W3P4_9PSEU|nr:bile acid:sodium symporter [Actinoalloteichus hoggarensis]ASO20293.1 Sodium Bile acid symporter family protein [Actinoalloteichus hoggarensis]MBB5918993.1 ACR3 family arsenite efflux pump ArsB [Actinoalloteichus hoggarensis]